MVFFSAVRCRSRRNSYSDFASGRSGGCFSRIRAGIASGEMAIGSPDEVAKTVERYVGTGADQLSFGMLSTSISLENCQEAVETFGKHVLPQFDKDPVHSTTKQRLAAK